MASIVAYLVIDYTRDTFHVKNQKTNLKKQSNHKIIYI